MKLLFLNAYCPPEQIAYTHLENDLIDALVDAGHTVDILCPTPTRGVTDEVRKKYKKIKYEETHGGKVRIHRFAAPKEGTNPVLRALRYLWCNLREYSVGSGFATPT